MDEHPFYRGPRTRIVLRAEGQWLKVWRTTATLPKSGPMKDRTELIAELRLDQLSSLIRWLQGIESEHGQQDSV